MEWIDIKKQMPKEREFILISCINSLFIMERRQPVIGYLSGKHLFNHEGRRLIDMLHSPTHWMPLPEPPALTGTEI